MFLQKMFPSMISGDNQTKKTALLGQFFFTPVSMKKFGSLISIALFFSACNPKEADVRQYTLTGPAQGSTFMVTYLAGPNTNLQSQVDSILVYVDKSMSTWVASSTISKANRGDTVLMEPVFRNVLEASKKMHDLTNGNFNITVGPLVRAWGFSKDQTVVPDSAVVDSLLNLIGMAKIRQRGDTLWLDKGVSIDFNAIAQGYTVDLISEFLQSKGIHNFMVEVGGELRTKGLNIKEKIWTIGIDKPQENLDLENRFQVIVSLPNKALATSGNYRKFYIDPTTGQRISHTISPFTGYPAKNNLLSASVVTPTAMEADALATAFMVMGLERSQKFLRLNPSVDAYLVYTDFKGEWQIFTTKGFEELIK